MDKPGLIYLPGTDKQIEEFFQFGAPDNGEILVVGPGTELIADLLQKHYQQKVIQIVEDADSLMLSRLRLGTQNSVSVRMMEFESTDFTDERFGLIYAQASVSGLKRNKIIREFKRISSQQCIFCIGEIVKLEDDVPKFVTDIWESSDIDPLHAGKIKDFYSNKGFDILLEKDLSHTLKDFYGRSRNKLLLEEGLLTDQEKSFYKKILNKISHESNAYLNLGGDKFIGFKMMIMRKTNK